MFHNLQHLKSIELFYCKNGGSSNGLREFIKKNLVSFAKENPSTLFYTKQQPGKHPFIKATYLNNYKKTIDIKNQKPNDIQNHLLNLTNQTGTKITHRPGNLGGGDALHFVRKNWNRANIGAANDPQGRQQDGRQPWKDLSARDKALKKSGGIPDSAFTHTSWFGIDVPYGLQKPVSFDSVQKQFEKVYPKDTSTSSSQDQTDMHLGFFRPEPTDPQLKDIIDMEVPLYPSNFDPSKRDLKKLGEGLFDEKR